MTSQDAEMASFLTLVTLIVVLPTLFAVTTPLLTEATNSSSLDQVTSLLEALAGEKVTVNVSVEPNKMLVSVLLRVIDSTTTSAGLQAVITLAAPTERHPINKIPNLFNLITKFLLC